MTNLRVTVSSPNSCQTLALNEGLLTDDFKCGEKQRWQAVQLWLSVKCLKCCYLSNSHIKPGYFCIKSSQKARRNAPRGLTLPHLGGGGFCLPSPGKRSAIARFSAAFLMFGKPLIQFDTVCRAVARFFVPGGGGGGSA